MPVPNRREKKPKVVVTFSSTGDAMDMEEAARSFGLPGRMIPLPGQISAGCGLAWCAPIEERGELLEGIAEHGLAHDGVFEVEMY
ncbi:MAG: DUF3343 domain-containing protein [Coriobacteriales bacterium]|jgi:hypothetical protein